MHSRRDHGGVIFLDLRDHSGIVQVVCEPSNADAFTKAEQLRPEHVIQASGPVRLRPDDTANPDMPTGEIEVLATTIEILNPATTPAFQLDDANVTEDTQLEHRVIYLRTAGMQHNLRVRHRLSSSIRQTLEENAFIEVETPMLTKSTPEGARDFLVPARSQPGHFYALPQSPQLFKQVLMAGGVDRYFQFARCFRDEDLRASRQPEFTQVDIEMAFVTEADVITLASTLIDKALQAAGCPSLGEIPTISYAKSMRDYGCDAPDLSVELKLVDVIDEVRDCGFNVFAKPAAQPGNRVVSLCVPGGGTLSRKQIDDLTDFVRKLGAGGLAYMKVEQPGTGEAGVNSPIAKFLGDDVVNAIVQKVNAVTGDIVFFGAGPAHIVNGYMAPLRVKVARELGLAKEGFYPVWVTEFPLFVRDPDTKALLCPHHPFTAPAENDIDDLLAGNRLEELNSRAYDLVLNGVELGGGSVRIHNRDVQLAALAAIGIDQEAAHAQFGFLLNTLAQGTPPHGGIAFGLDRLVAMALGEESIRSVIAFPKTQRGQCLFTQAPQPVAKEQLSELGLSVRSKPN